VKKDKEFYVGYIGAAPPKLGKTNFRRILIVSLLVLACAGLFAYEQASFGNGKWHAEEQHFEGLIEGGAVPVLAVLKEGVVSRYTLVTPFKYGAQDTVAPFVGKWVSLSGTLIERDTVKMIELIPESIKRAAEQTSPASDTSKSLGRHRFSGEIVDSKCFLGVMNPGNLKTHKQCAILCIKGGVPPVLLVRDTEGKATYLHLVSPEGEAVNEAVLEFVAEPIEVEGEVEVRGNLFFLKADPETYRRVED
jgi:hypothetical protein